tara:strand:- start:194 stop:1627 length:1434 start_codon:yes stop_codon:yes gene_type:complete
MVSILGANSASDSYEVSNSLRFNDDDDAALSRSVSGNLSKAHTFSLWIKRANLKGSGRHTLIAMGDGSGDISWLELNNDRLAIVFDGSGTYWPKTDAVLRDVSAWYHICVAVDTTESTAANRVKFYINGVQFTDTNGTFPPLNHQAVMDACVVGYNPGDEFDGYMAEVHVLDGVAYGPTYFGKFDNNNVWVPIEYTGGNYGTFGFYLEFKQTGTSQNSSGIGADTSGNDNHFAVTNLAATDVTTDTCTNNYATMSTIHPSASNFTISEGNLKISKSGTGTVGLYGQTLMATSGKWYFEVKIVTRGTSDRTRVGIANYESVTGTSTIQDSYSGLEISTAESDKIFTVVDGSTTENETFYTALSDNDIVRFAVDMDNGRLYLGVNGNWWNYSSSQTGGDPTSGSGYVTDNTTIFNGSPMTAYSAHSAGLSTSSVQEFNFGNPTFAISSGNSDANGYGNFEYAVPSGYYAYNTKNLAEFG